MTAVRRLFLMPALLLAGSSILHADGVPDFAAANLVLGQSLFTTNTAVSPANATSLATPNGVAVDPVSGKVFVADTGNNRVLRYASQTALANGAIPEIVIGQVNFSAGTANQGNGITPSQTSLSAPSDVFVDDAGRLWIADTGNSRVLLFENAANLFNTPFADRVYGQPDFATSTANTTQSKLAGPNGVCVDPAGVLWVADTGGHRVVAWKNAASLPNGMPADRVLGQTNFTDNTSDASQTKLFNPRGIAADATHVWVADSGNNRVVMFSNFPAINGAPANLVLGQTNYTAHISATADNGMNTPTSVALSGTTLYVADAGNNRVLSFLAAATLVNGGVATGVVGQATFITGTSGLSSQRIALFYSHIGLDAGGDLFVADTLNNRVLRFAYVVTTVPVTPTVATSVTLTGSKKIKTHNYFVKLRGTAASSSGIRRVSYNLNDQGYVKAKGTTSWNAKISLPFGRSEIIINSVALDGTISPPLKVIVTRK